MGGNGNRDYFKKQTDLFQKSNKVTSSRTDNITEQAQAHRRKKAQRQQRRPEDGKGEGIKREQKKRENEKRRASEKGRA